MFLLQLLVSKVLKDPVVQSARKFLEIGTGSGAISLALLNSLPDVSCFMCCGFAYAQSKLEM